MKLLKPFALLIFMISAAHAQYTEGSFPNPNSELKTARRNLKVGVLSGVNNPEGSPQSSAETGVTMTFSPMNRFTSGLDLTTSKLDNADDFQRTSLLATSAYKFPGANIFTRNSYVGAGLGPVFVDNRVEVGFAPMIGFDIPLAAKKIHKVFSLGANVKLQTYSSSEDSTITTAALKYWF